MVMRQSLGVDSVRVSQACLAHRISVAMSGALPCIKRPTLKTLAANQVTAHAAARPTIIVRSTCQVGGGVADPSRIIIANVLTGGMKLSATANAENNFNLSADELHVLSATANEGPTLKRFRPRAQGRTFSILKRTSHIAVTVADREES